MNPDSSCDLDYMHYRFYGSNMGRFMKPDNISGNMDDPQSWNLYSYAGNNPVNANDPTGHMWITSTIVHNIFAAATGADASKLGLLSSQTDPQQQLATQGISTPDSQNGPHAQQSAAILSTYMVKMVHVFKDRFRQIRVGLLIFVK